MAVAMEKILTYVLLDLETTGLPGIGENPRIVEMSLIAVQRKHLLEHNTDCPRIMDKLVFCVNPGGKPMTCGASLITGIYNDVLEDLPVFDDKVVKMLTLFLTRLPQPVCFLAHNGNKFDFPMLKAELERINQELPSGILCGDTLEAFRVIDPTRKAGNQNGQNGTFVAVKTSSKSAYTSQTPSVTATATGTSNNAVDSNVAFYNEITPVKPHENIASCFVNPPPAPRKKRNCPDNARDVGNMQAAKRRLLQDDSRVSASERGGHSDYRNSGRFQLGTCAASPPPSPLAPRSVTRRKLAFGDAPSNGSGEATPVSSSAAALAKFHFSPGTKSENSDELLPFPDDFSDDQCDMLDAPENSDKDLDLQQESDLNQNALERSDSNTTVTEKSDTSLDLQNQGVNLSACQPSTSNLSNNFSSGRSFTDSLQDDELIAEVDQLMSTGSDQSAGVTDRCGDSKCTASDVGTSTSAVSQEVVVATSNVIPEQVNAAKNLALPMDIYSGQTTPTRREQTVIRICEANTCLTKEAKNQANQTKQICEGSGVSVSINDNAGTSATGSSASLSSHTPRKAQKSFKLDEIYNRVFGHYPQVSHAAEDDCITLLKIIQSCTTKFGQWLDENAVQFSDL